MQCVNLNTDTFSVDEEFVTSFPVNFVVYADSLVNWIPPGIFKISCDMDIKWFPFDEQLCLFKVNFKLLKMFNY